MPIPLIAVGLLEALGPWIARYFIAKAAWMIAKCFIVAGVAFATNEVVIEPLLNHIEGAWAAMPPAAGEWLRFFGFPQVLSIWLSTAAIVGVKEVFLSKRE